MAVQNNDDFRLFVRTATGPDVWTLVNDISRFGKRSNRSISSFSVFGRSTAYSIPGTREETYTVAGFINPADTGQNYLRTAEQTNASVFIRIEFVSGAGQGYEQQVRVGSTSFDAAAGGGLQEDGFEFSAVAPATAFGSPGVLI